MVCLINNNLPTMERLSISPVYLEIQVCYLLSGVWHFAIPWTVAYQAPLSMKFSSQEYWPGLPFPFPWDLPDPGIEPESPSLQADYLLFEPTGKHGNIIGTQIFVKYKNKLKINTFWHSNQWSYHYRNLCIYELM